MVVRAGADDWIAAHVVRWRLHMLAGHLQTATPELDRNRIRGWTPRDPEVQLHYRIITMRDAEWALLGFVDEKVAAAAWRAAKESCRGADSREVQALATACVLHLAIRARAAGKIPVISKIEFPQMLADGPLRSIWQEAADLLAIQRAWDSPVALTFPDEYSTTSDQNAREWLDGTPFHPQPHAGMQCHIRCYDTRMARIRAALTAFWCALTTS